MQLPGKILNVLPGTVILVTDEDEKQERKECWTYYLAVERVFAKSFANHGVAKILYVKSPRRFSSSLDAKQAMREELAWQRKHHCCG
jgi:hypothetical protein